jgi:hypothetical protein
MATIKMATKPILTRRKYKLEAPTCNFEVNPITHLGVLALFSSNL